MPEQLSKHPEVTLQVLRSAGARCGEGEPQDILVQCPPQRFCKLPGGEVCVFGLPDAAKMTQVSAAEWQALAPPGPATAAGADSPFGAEVLVAGAVGVLVGAGLAVAAVRLRAR